MRFRRPRTKYAIGTAPRELMNVTATAHLTFEPRTSLAGRRARSTRAALLSTPSMVPATTISRRVRGERSLHFFFLLTIRTLTAVRVSAGEARGSQHVDSHATSKPHRTRTRTYLKGPPLQLRLGTGSDPNAVA